jgi:SAM-dependent methyltransferase
MFSSEPPSGANLAALQQRPFVVRNGRSYIADPSLHYPLPVDLAELHRQSLRTLLLFQLFGGPVCSPVFSNRPPTRVLEVGCGSAFWSMMCHRYYARHGHTNISFTGIDIAPIAPGASGHGTSTRAGSTVTGDGTGGTAGGNRTSASSTLSGVDGKPDKDMRWRFVQHDMRRLPWPFADGEFDLVMVKDMSLATPLALQQTLIDEYVRLLRPGGVLEIWESDYTLRMLRPHVPLGGQQSSQQAQKAARQQEDSEDDTEDSDSEEDEHEAAANLGAYLMTANTPLSAPTNNFLVEYNGWVSKALEARSLSAVPCTLIGSLLLQEVETLSGLGSKRLAVPLSEVRWEREGVGGVVTKDGKSYIESTKGYRGGKRNEAAAGRPLGAGQAAVRRTALLTVVTQIQSLEAVLREVSGKSQDEWDGWCGKMMNDLVKENGTSWGECLETGAWWARKKA